LPSPVEVYKTLAAEVQKRYGERVAVIYIDMDDMIPDNVEEMADVIAAQDKWLPVIALGDEIIGEGILRLPDVWKAVQQRGVK
jgi:disulfide oxidoreductase YuzD